MNPFQSLRDYEAFIYALYQQFPCIVRSTLVVAQRAARMATVTGEVHFSHDYRLVIKERLTFDDDVLVLKHYGYEVWCGNQKLYWCDSQPHPNDPLLAVTAPHHKHVPPDIKHHRVPASSLSFTEPNLPFLIQEVTHLLKDG